MMLQLLLDANADPNAQDMVGVGMATNPTTIQVFIVGWIYSTNVCL